MSRNAAIERANKSEVAAVNSAAKRANEAETKDDTEVKTKTQSLRQTPRTLPKPVIEDETNQETPRRSSRARHREEEKEKEESEEEEEESEIEEDDEEDEEIEEEEEEEEEEEPKVQTSSLNCGYCNMEYNSDPSIKRHFRLKHPECEYNQMLVSLYCDKCDKGFDDQRQFAVHMVRNHPQFWIFDDKGNRVKSSSETSENKGVLDTIKNGDRFSCELCSKTFTSKSRLTMHKQTQHGAYDRIWVELFSDALSFIWNDP